MIDEIKRALKNTHIQKPPGAGYLDRNHKLAIEIAVLLTEINGRPGGYGH
jgi:hypothetical protein